MCSTIEKLKSMNSSNPPVPSAEDLLPEERNAMMEKLDALLPMIAKLPEAVEGASGQVLMVGDRLEQEMSRKMTVWKEEIYLTTMQSSNAVHQEIDQLERMHRENAALLKNLTSRFYPMVGIAAALGATIVGLIWMILS